jgi:hypothetical protein
MAGVGEGVAAGQARAPMRLMSRFTAAEVKGRPRSVANTNADSGDQRATASRFRIWLDAVRHRLLNTRE